MTWSEIYTIVSLDSMADPQDVDRTCITKYSSL